MQLPLGLDSGFFLSEAVFSTVLSDDLIVSATMHWVVFWAALDPQSWLMFWFCFLSGVSPTDICSVPFNTSVLLNNNNYTHQTGSQNRKKNQTFGQLSHIILDACLRVYVSTLVFSLCWLHKLWCSERQQATQSPPPPCSETERHSGFWVALWVPTLKHKQRQK